MTVKPTKQASEKQTRLFDIQKESARIAVALAKLKDEQKPGEASGMGTKTVILMQQEKAIKELHEAGYTVKQIAEAMSNDVFGILPKSITQLLNKHATTRTKQQKRTVQPAVKKAAEITSITPANTPAKTKQVTEIGDVE